MKVNTKFINGLVFGISHQYYLDFDNAEGDTFQDKLDAAKKVPMVFIYIGPLQIIVTW